MSSTANRSEDSDELRLAPVREGETVADKYVVGKVLGVGGMGVVVLATDRVLERKVAIKFLLANQATSAKAVQRFIREARVSTRITSEHVVKLLEIDMLPSGTPFFAMEYLEGWDLRALMGETGALPSAEAVDYVLQALQAIAEGHLLGIVHRDIKPSNLFVTRRADGTVLIKVLDFGIAKTAELEGSEVGALTGSGDTRLGSPSYMSPEQLQNPSEVDVRSDVWALGVTLYELVCGSPPFRGKTYADLVLAITSTTPDPPSRRRPDRPLPRGLAQVIMRCLARDRTLRYASALDLATALAPFGSEDAQASLRRVRGLGTPAPGPSTPRRDTPQPAPYTSTVPIGGTLGAGETRRSPVVEAPRPPRSKRPIALALALGLVVVAWFAWMLRPSPKPESATLVREPEPKPANPAPLRPLPSAAASPPPVAELAPPSVPETSRPASVPQPAPVEPASTPAEPALPRPGSRPVSRPVVSVALPAASSSSAQEPVAANSSEPADADAPVSSGRSAVIERLIQNRR